ncbi:integrating conjugative element protein [Pseudomonas aeruginosa]|uniref:integrating conjugative element protein n=1 Tax=Pseudomonas aeruginosa TaxID=287 RepID=UPI00071C19E5|nr:integrating conjugative element protein [Pseudomonas aeruginosa]KSQ24951.1 integrating conjugative element protein [Pseudomonas aeruginosa]MCO1686914.1 integrating conjugative element protein [Pseudomonas aeruginosa]MCO1780329.1 integrating conjugative element protein [Pseudomonas aeruginosa]MCO1790185.1 integrating conjugative element protein [Pseudomonas aeruginosa]MCO1799175.1 integrating conjugative element protein [Pseudomonas aeruginosa]
MKPHRLRRATAWLLGLSALAATQAALAQSYALIVVEDRGGTSALPYYEALKLQLRTGMRSPRIELPRARAEPFSEADMLPVRSSRLSPGDVARRTIKTPGMPPFFLIGDDLRSREWLRQRAPRLRELNAMGLVVNVDSAAALAALRALAPELSLSPTPGDDLARRLRLRHYPVLITATGIEQ